MKFEFNGQEYYIDGYLAAQLLTIAYNLPKDWDIVIIITGDRVVRIGKSVLAITVCAFLAYVLKRMGKGIDFTIDDIYFDNKEMMEKAQEKPPYSINLYDEGREGLAANKAFSQVQKDLIDFFTECGQLNQIFVVVAPDFFDLKEYMAVARSEVLLNVYRKETPVKIDLFKDGTKYPVIRFDRGYFEFFSRARKRNLFDKSQSTRRKSYALVQHNFRGRFTNQYPIDETAYRQKKKEALARFKERHEKEKEPARRKSDDLRDALIFDWKAKGMNNTEIAKKFKREFDFDIDRSYVSQILKKYGILEGKGAA